MHEGACEGCWPPIHVTPRHPHKLSPSQQRVMRGTMRGVGTNPYQPKASCNKQTCKLKAIKPSKFYLNMSTMGPTLRHCKSVFTNFSFFFKLWTSVWSCYISDQNLSMNIPHPTFNEMHSKRCFHTLGKWGVKPPPTHTVKPNPKP